MCVCGCGGGVGEMRFFFEVRRRVEIYIFGGVSFFFQLFFPRR